MMLDKDIITIKLQRPPITIKKEIPLVRVINQQVLKPLSPEQTMNLEASQSSPPRKRQRLDHLSMDEKILRRKMRNREAAQTARDRKKAYVDEMEKKTRQLEAKNSALQSQFLALQAKYSQLQKETEALRSENMSLKGLSPNSDIDIKVEPCEEVSLGSVDAVVPGPPVEPAELVAPQQRDQSVPEVVATTVAYAFLYIYLLAVLTFKSDAYSDSSRSYYRTWNQTSQRSILPSQNLPEKHVTLKWWGRHQQSWNPAQDSSTTITPYPVNY